MKMNSPSSHGFCDSPLEKTCSSIGRTLDVTIVDSCYLVAPSTNSFSQVELASTGIIVQDPLSIHKLVNTLINTSIHRTNGIVFQTQCLMEKT